MLASCAIHTSHEIANVLRPIVVPYPNLVLLRVTILLCPGNGAPLTELKGRSVDPVGGAERRGEHEPDLERRPAAVLKKRVQYIRGVGEEIRPQVFGDLRLRQ